jgi:prefoldin subunit 5
LKAAIKDFQKRIEELAEMSKAITMALEELTHYQKITMGQLQKLGTTPVTSVRKKKIPFRVLDGGRVKENLVPLK